MNSTTPEKTYWFDRIFVVLAIGSPILMVIAAGMLPLGSRGPFIVTGHECLVAILGLALVPRVVHAVTSGSGSRPRCIHAPHGVASIVGDEQCAASAQCETHGPSMNRLRCSVTRLHSDATATAARPERKNWVAAHHDQ
jgi:hypothetical protein